MIICETPRSCNSVNMDEFGSSQLVANKYSNGERHTCNYEEALDALSSLITYRIHVRHTDADGYKYFAMLDYLKILDLDGSISRMKVIHVAGTKGKGSTCTFVESILRNCGFHTGLFTSPHLIDVRERFRLDGIDICVENFLHYFWWCWDRLKEHTKNGKSMPTLFQFFTLLAFKIFSEEKVDVVILEVGMGGKYDATNVVQTPIVCGVTSLGYDHMEILGHTLAEISEEKAGIFKPEVPAFTVSQPAEAMNVLIDKASGLGLHLKVTSPLDSSLMNGRHLGLDGEHQHINSGLAVALCNTWLQRTGKWKAICAGNSDLLPEEFIRGLTTATLQGRAHVVYDYYFSSEKSKDLVFYLDGAHSPESMEVCAKWFCQASQEGRHENSVSHSTDNLEKILLFNCMSERDPYLLFPRLKNTCDSYGVNFGKAIFVPNISSFNKVGIHSLPSMDSRKVDWQLHLQKVWDTLSCKENGIACDGESNKKVFEIEGNNHQELTLKKTHDIEGTSAVFSSLPGAIKWIRDTVQKNNNSVRFQVLVTGSLHLVGDVLRLIRK